MEFEEWWTKEPVGEFEGIHAGHVKRAWEAAAKAEREACAKICDELAKKYDESIDPVEDLTCQECAQAIRERSNGRGNGLASTGPIKETT